MQHRLVRVGRVDAGDRLERTTLLRAPLLHVAPRRQEAELDVLARELASGVEFHALAQGQLDAQTVVGHLPLGGEVGLRLELVDLVADQRLVDEADQGGDRAVGVGEEVRRDQVGVDADGDGAAGHGGVGRRARRRSVGGVGVGGVGGVDGWSGAGAPVRLGRTAAGEHQGGHGDDDADLEQSSSGCFGPVERHARTSSRFGG